MTVLTRTCDGATPVIVSTAAAAGDRRRARDRRGGGRYGSRSLQVVENDVDRQDACQRRQRPVPVHPRVHDGHDSRVARLAVGQRSADRVDLGLDRGEPRLVARQSGCLAAHDRTLVHVEPGQEHGEHLPRQPRRSAGSSWREGPLPTLVNPFFETLASAGRRLTACISAQLPDRLQLRGMRGRRESETSCDASTAASGSATRMRARTRRSSSSTRPGMRVVPPVTRISASASESGCAW